MMGLWNGGLCLRGDTAHCSLRSKERTHVIKTETLGLGYHEEKEDAERDAEAEEDEADLRAQVACIRVDHVRSPEVRTEDKDVRDNHDKGLTTPLLEHILRRID